MGEHFSGSIHFGIVADEDYLYERYGAKLEEPDCEFEYATEAFEDEVDKLADGKNLHTVTIGHYADDGSPMLLALKEPHVENDYSDAYYAAPFDPRALTAQPDGPHQFAVDVANQLGLDWSKAAWLLCWSVG